MRLGKPRAQLFLSPSNARLCFGFDLRGNDTGKFAKEEDDGERAVEGCHGAGQLNDGSDLSARHCTRADITLTQQACARPPRMDAAYLGEGLVEGRIANTFNNTNGQRRTEFLWHSHVHRAINFHCAANATRALHPPVIRPDNDNYECI